jgi:hypothetical protein
VSKNKQIYELWKLIDDIDTATDAYKIDAAGFQRYTTRKIKERFIIVGNRKVEKLYNKYYPSQTTNTTTRNEQS